MKNYATAIYFGQRLLKLEGGICGGPLFNEYGKRRAAILRCSRMHGIRRRAREKRATPPWLSPADRKRIRDLEAACEALNAAAGEPLYHLDHIVPLAGKIVCGLHVPWNLVVRLREENLAKGAWTWPDMPMTQLELL